MSLHKNTATGPKNNVYRKKGMARRRNGTRAESQAQCERDRESERVEKDIPCEEMS